MCIYCTTTNYRKIYESHHGLIPKESDGRTYEIHHIDGNHNNNSPSNLTAVPIQEHYDIHYAQGDFGACMLMKLQRMDHTPKEISILASDAACKRVKDGTHPFLSGEIQRKNSEERIKNGTHNLLSGEIQRINNQKRIEDSTHNLLGDKNPVYKQLENGTHPSQIKVCCIHCKKEIRTPALMQWHGDKCKQKN